VHPEQALRMAAALYAARHPFRFVFLEGGDHGLTGHTAEVDRWVAEWFDAYVRDGRSLPNLEPHGR
jgi:dipeptidyl aminopeptidase/acylaminoacyl peptidase